MKRLKPSHYLVFGTLIFVTLGCEKDNNDAPSPFSEESPVEPLKNAEVETYRTQGFVLELVPEDLGAFIHHEKIPGFMDEMTMYLKVANAAEFGQLKIGHQYTFDLIVDQKQRVIVKGFTPTGKTSDATVGTETPGERWSQKPTLELGASAPDFVCKNTRGEELRPSTLQGSAWAITFIFTRCPLPDYCPLMTARFKEAAAMLEAAKELNWQLISVTIDPEHDHLPILANYRQGWELDSPNIHFCRAEPTELSKIGDPLGLRFETDRFPIEHNLRTAVFNSDGKLVEVFSGNNWTAQELVNSMTAANP